MPAPADPNWFDRGGDDYARFRPTYPPALAAALARMAPSHALAVDVGCGTGQLSGQLAEHFDTVLATDPSPAQLGASQARARVHYVRAAAEALPVAGAAAQLVTAAQAAHWFDLPAFYRQVRRIAAPGAVLALITYGTPHLDGAVDRRFQHFYAREIGPYWPAARRLVDDGYRTADFPFTELTAPPLRIEQRLDLAGLLGYVATWSAVRAAARAGQETLMTGFADDLARIWGDPDRERLVSWPIAMRVGVM